MEGALERNQETRFWAAVTDSQIRPWTSWLPLSRPQLLYLKLSQGCPVGSSQAWVPRCSVKVKAVVRTPLSDCDGCSTRFPGLPSLSRGCGLGDRRSRSPTGKRLPGLKARSLCFPVGPPILGDLGPILLSGPQSRDVPVIQTRLEDPASDLESFL